MRRKVKKRAFSKASYGYTKYVRDCTFEVRNPDGGWLNLARMNSKRAEKEKNWIKQYVLKDPLTKEEQKEVERLEREKRQKAKEEREERKKKREERIRVYSGSSDTEDTVFPVSVVDETSDEFPNSSTALQYERTVDFDKEFSRPVGVRELRESNDSDTREAGIIIAVCVSLIIALCLAPFIVAKNQSWEQKLMKIHGYDHVETCMSPEGEVHVGYIGDTTYGVYDKDGVLLCGDVMSIY